MFAALQTHGAPFIPKSLFYIGIQTAKYSYGWIIKKDKFIFHLVQMVWFTVLQNISLFFWNRCGENYLALPVPYL